jgi:hypothetical protein
MVGLTQEVLLARAIQVPAGRHWQVWASTKTQHRRDSQQVLLLGVSSEMCRHTVRKLFVRAWRAANDRRKIFWPSLMQHLG